MIQKFYDLLTRLGITRGHDKVLHVIAGFIVGSVMVVLFYKTIYPVIAVVMVAVGKELYDKYIKKTYFDFFDMFATLLGGWVGIMLVGLLKGL